jgi:DNA helicase HerA-like ATPase
MTTPTPDESGLAAADIAKAYASDGPAVDLGAVVIAGTAHPESQVRLPLSMMNRHGLVAGATGTGKTKTLQLMAEQLSAAGVPVLLADVKGDLSGVAAPGAVSDRSTKRANEVGATDWAPAGTPVEFLTLGNDGNDGKGAQLRATMTSFGPVLLSKTLGLNDVQSSSLGLVFHWADRAGLPLLDLKDLRAVITHLSSDAGAAELAELGGLSKATAGVILRELIAFADQGGEQFFGEPEFDTAELLRTTPDGKGVVSVLELASVQDKPALFSTFLMWLLADLHHDLPEVGDLDRPKLVFFFDEAHLLFRDASKDFLDQIAQTVRLIRSKGVGVFFVTQVPTDVPPEVLAQLGNRVQHALRVFTPSDAKSLSSTVSTFPRSKVYDLAELLPSLGIGEAVVTVLSETGAPTPVAWTRLRPPTSLMAQLDPAEQTRMVQASPIAIKYADVVDRESAYEKLLAKVSPPAEADKQGQPAAEDDHEERRSRSKRDDDDGDGGIGDKVSAVLGSSAFKAFTRNVGSQVGREITRSLFGTARKRR